MSHKPEYKPMLDSSLGKDMTREDCEVMVSVMGSCDLKDGEILVNEGEKDHTLFILVDGKIAVDSDIDGKTTTVYTMKQGECAGTRAFVDLAPR